MKEKIFKKGIKKRLFSVVLALAMVFSLLPMNSITAYAAPTQRTVIINSDELAAAGGTSLTKDGVTVTATGLSDGNITGPGTFTTAAGKFTEIKLSGYTAHAYTTDGFGDGWENAEDDRSIIWEGDASNSVSFSGSINCLSGYEIVFTISGEHDFSQKEDEPTKHVCVDCGLVEEHNLDRYCQCMCGAVVHDLADNGICRACGFSPAELEVIPKVEAVKDKLWGYAHDFGNMSLADWIQELTWGDGDCFNDLISEYKRDASEWSYDADKCEWTLKLGREEVKFSVTIQSGNVVKVVDFWGSSFTHHFDDGACVDAGCKYECTHEDQSGSTFVDSVCSICNYNCAAKGHVKSTNNWTEKDSTEHQMTCSVCNEVATGNHDFSQQPYQTDDAGKHYQICKDCGAESEHVACTPGEAVRENIVAPTCGGAGSHNEVVYCTVCNQKLRTTPVTDPATGAHTYTKYVSLGNGKHKVVCKDCNAIQSGHDADDCSGGTATCKEKAKCSKCGAEYGSIAAHIDADKNEKCDVCGYDMHVHAGTKVAQVNATCKAFGVKEYYKCSCGKYYTDSACTKEITDLATWKSGDGRIAKKDHTLKTATTKATTSKNGKKETKCTVCGKVTKTETIYMAKTIKLSATSYTYDGKVKKPTVTIKDSKGKAIASSNYTITYPSGRKNVGKYTVKVTFKGNYSGTKSLTFTINPSKTSISKITAGKKAFTVTWAKKTTQVTGYEIQYSTSSTFKSGNKTVKVTSAKTASKAISKLTGGKKYYVRIRTYKTVGKTPYYSDWSAKKSVTTKK